MEGEREGGGRKASDPHPHCQNIYCDGHISPGAASCNRNPSVVSFDYYLTAIQ